MTPSVAQDYNLDDTAEDPSASEPWPEFARECKKELPRSERLPFFVDPAPDSYMPQHGDIPRVHHSTEFVQKPLNSPVIFPEKIPTSQERFVLLQQWEGVVIETTTDSFTARLVDLTEEGPDEEAEFSMDEVSEEDRPLVQPQAIFYWNIGYHDTRRGQRIRESLIRFRRLPAWQKTELRYAKEEAARIRDIIGWK